MGRGAGDGPVEGDPLVTGRIGSFGILVAKGIELGGAPQVQNVVVPGPLKLHLAQVGAGPADAVPALGVATHFRVLGNDLFSRKQFLPDDVVVVRAAPVVHAVDVAVPEDGDMGRCVALPGLVELKNLLPGLRLPQLQFHAVHGLDEVAVHEELQAASHVQDLRGVGFPGGGGSPGSRGRPDGRQQGPEKQSSG